MKFSPLPAQKLMIEFLKSHPREAALFCGMGVSKTASVLSVINDEFKDGIDSSTLIVAPLRVARLTWPNEVALWDEFRWMKPEILRGKRPSGKSPLYCVNYERLADFKDFSFVKRIVFDELTKAKNHASKRINHIRPLIKNHARWGLTGTPRPNSLLDLFAQIRLLDEGKRLSPSFTHFRNANFIPTDYMEYNWAPKPGAEKRIYEKISDLCLTLRSEDWTDLPDTVLEDVEVSLPEEAQKFYKKLERELLVEVQHMGDVVAPSAAALVNKLLQTTGGTVYTEDRAVVKVHDAKVKALKSILKKVDDTVLIATNYVHERERVVAELGPQAIDAAKFKGDIESSWNQGEIRWLVADPRSLGHGLNLQRGGNTIVWYSLTYSREAYDQFNARLARRGQTKTPMVYRLVCPGTIDDAVAECLREKGDGQHEMLRLLTEWQKLARAA